MVDEVAALRKVGHLPPRKRARLLALMLLRASPEILPDVSNPKNGPSGQSYEDSGQLALMYFRTAILALNILEINENKQFRAPIDPSNSQVEISSSGFIFILSGDWLRYGRTKNEPLSGAYSSSRSLKQVSSDHLWKELIKDFEGLSSSVNFQLSTAPSLPVDPFSHNVEFWADDKWDFWKEWYRSLQQGMPISNELQKSIALIEEREWQKGPAHIASMIEKLRLKTRTDVSPSLVRSTDNTTFEVEHDTRLPDEVLAFVCNRIESTLHSALSAGPANGFHDGSEEAQVIRAVLDSDAKGASLVATAFYDACLSLTTNIGDRYPEVTSLVNLKNALYAAVEEICELDELARKRCARLAKLQTAQPMTPEDRVLVAEASEIVGDDVNEEAREIIESDVERILSTPTPPKSIRARFANWMTTISLWLDKAEKTDKKAKWLSDLVSRMQRWWPTGGE